MRRRIQTIAPTGIFLRRDRRNVRQLRQRFRDRREEKYRTRWPTVGQANFITTRQCAKFSDLSMCPTD